MTDQNPETPREPSGAINHHQENVAPQSDQDRVVGQDAGHDAGSIDEAPDGRSSDGGTPANQGPVPAEPEDMSDTGSDIGSLAPDPAAEEVAE